MKRNILKVISLAVVSSIVFTSCSIDSDKLKEGVSDLKDAISDTDEEAKEAETTIADESETSEETLATIEDTEPTEIVEPTEEPVPTETPTPTPTEVPTPTEIPSPERVDLSELQQIDIDEYIINVETFEESYVTEEGIVLATLSGTNMLVECDDNTNVQKAINSILDGFYQETYGIYGRMISENNAEYAIYDEDADIIPYDVTISYAYSNNGRVLSVIMRNEVLQGEEVVSSNCEYVSFDLITGQFITLAVVADDYYGLNKALADKLVAYTEDEDISASDVTNIAIIAQMPGAESATADIYGTINGETVHTAVDLNDYNDLMNRYGKTIYGLN